MPRKRKISPNQLVLPTFKAEHQPKPVTRSEFKRGVYRTLTPKLWNERWRGAHNFAYRAGYMNWARDQIEAGAPFFELSIQWSSKLKELVFRIEALS